MIPGEYILRQEPIVLKIARKNVWKWKEPTYGVGSFALKCMC